MKYLFYIFLFFLIYLLYFVFVIARKKTREKFKKSNYVLYLVNMYKIDVAKISAKTLASSICFVNALILTVCIFIIMNMKGIISIVVAFIAMLLLLFLLYHILGTILKRKGDKHV